MNLPKVETQSEVVKTENQLFSSEDHESLYHDYVDFYHLNKNLCDIKAASAVMLPENITLCEINACLWVKAAYSATSSLSRYTYTHYIIVQKFINYLLNTDSTENFGLVENFLWKLLVNYPPNQEMFDYYWQILFDKYVSLDGKETEDQSLFFCLIEAVINCLKVNMSGDGSIDLEEPVKRNKSLAKTEASFSSLDLESLCIDARERFNISLNKSSKAKGSEKQSCFDKLPCKEKIKRCFIVLNFVLDILETDFIFWSHSKEYKPLTDNDRPLISHLLWKNQRDIGFLNKEIQKVFQLYKLAMGLDNPTVRVVTKLVTLIGEIVRWSDRNEDIKYPFVGMNSTHFVRELSLILHHRLLELKNNPDYELIVNFKPPWLRLFVCSQLLTLITGHQCNPELPAVYDILEYIVNMKSRYSSIIKSPVLKPAPVRKRKEIKSINAQLKNGKTQLHQACEENDVEKIRTLLSFPELEVNAVNRDGWTALHLASQLGKTNSVKELLSFCDKRGGVQKSVNTRVKGPQNTTPLMCAASQGHANICNLLLEHSGSILLQDVNEFNQTAWELSNSSTVRRTLKSYKNNDLCAKNYSRGINFDIDFKKIVIKLCVEMTQAYFLTYKTWEIHRKFRQSGNNPEENLTASGNDLTRYNTDIKININKLKSLLPNLESVEEFRSLIDIFKTIILINKT